MLKLTAPTSFLRFAKNMTVAELKNISNKDLMVYQSELETFLKLDYEADLHEIGESNQQLTALAEQVYGNTSKQVKYLGRNFQKGENVVDLHYKQYPNMRELTQWIENSKGGAYADSCVPGFGYKSKEELQQKV